MLRLLCSSWHRNGDTFTEGFIFFSQEDREVTELIASLICLKCLQLKIILMPEWHILRCHPSRPQESGSEKGK
jgi:hypothetical protein